MEAVYGSRKWRTLAPVAVLQAFVQQQTSPMQQAVILVQVRVVELGRSWLGPPQRRQAASCSMLSLFSEWCSRMQFLTV